MSDEALLTAYLWPIVPEMIKTAIENEQNLTVEGCCIPFDRARDFEPEYQDKIRYYCLVMSEKYIHTHFADIRKYASVIENRREDEGCTPETVLAENAEYLKAARQYKVNYILIDDGYDVNIKL